MSTFLQLCQRARQECGISGSGPSTVVSQTGEMKRVVDWVASAYDDICARKTNWKFLRSSFTVNTVIGQEAYLPTACTDSILSALIGSSTVGAFGQWMPETFRIYLQSAGVATQQNFWPLGYEWFRDRYQLQPPANSKPAEFTVRPSDNALLMGPKPEAVYVVTGDYYRTAPPLAVDADVPLFPSRFHMAVVWRAAQLYAGWEEDGGVHAHATHEFNKLYGPLTIDQLPQVELPGPLA